MSLASRWLLQAIQASDRRRLRRLAAQHPGLQIDPSASTNFARARIAMGPGAVLKIGANVATERTPGAPPSASTSRPESSAKRRPGVYRP